MVLGARDDHLVTPDRRGAVVTVGGTTVTVPVANDITLVGNANFHYDESLANFGVGNPFRVSIWRELTSAAQRNTVAGQLSF